MHNVITPNASNQYPYAVLIKETAFSSQEIHKHYISKSLLSDDLFICFGLPYNDNNKAPVKLIKTALEPLLRNIGTVGSKTLLVADTAYYKQLTGERTTEKNHGSIKPCKIKGYEDISIILCPNYQALFHNPLIQEKIDMAISTLDAHVSGTHTKLGAGIIHSAYYPDSYEDIKIALEALHEHREITCDVETFSLKHWDAGIGSIAFSWNEHEGIAFLVDYANHENVTVEGYCGYQINRAGIKWLLHDFFLEYKGTVIYHNATFDVTILTYNLFMNSLQDYEGLVKGLAVMCNRISDTKIIAYLALNTTTEISLSLKDLAFEFAGDYGQEDINDIRLIPKEVLLEYNLKDCLATYWVGKKFYRQIIIDYQYKIYKQIFIPGVKTIVHMTLIGMPMNMRRVEEVEIELSSKLSGNKLKIASHPLIQKYEWQLERLAMIDANLLLKKKVKPMSDFNINFNPNSGKQIAGLLYEQFGYEITDTTATGLPATGAKVLEKHLDKLKRDFNLTDEELL